MRAPPLPSLASLAVAGVLTLVVALGVTLRLEDPLSSPAIGAEDPYTHIVFTKEAIERGYFDDSRHLGTSLYPPGIHAFTGAFAPLAGVELYDFARFAPAILGGIAIVGMYLLGARLAGAAAGLVAALVTAFMPEHIFRTNLFFPTAFDLALLPAYLLAFDLATRPSGEHATPWRSPLAVGGAALFLVLSVPLAFLHPWAVPLFALPLGIYVGLRALRGAREDIVLRVGWAAALLVVATAFAMASRWTESDTGFADFLGALPGLAPLASLDLAPPLLFVVLLLLLGALAAGATLVVPLAAAALARVPERVRVVGGWTAGGALALVATLLSFDLPQDVHYLHNLGYFTVALALVGLVIAVGAPTRLGDMGLALGVALFPLTAFDLFGSPYWPQRTVAYLALGAALLAAVAGLALVRWLRRAIAQRRRSWAPAAPAAGLVAGLALVGTAVALDPAEPYPWYRLYEDEEFAGFEELAGILNEDEDTRAVVYSWQPGLVLKALADPAQVRYSPPFYLDAEKRDGVLEESDDRTFVVVDKHVLRAAGLGKADVGFLDSGGYELLWQSDNGRLQIWEVRA